MVDFVTGVGLWYYSKWVQNPWLLSLFPGKKKHQKEQSIKQKRALLCPLPTGLLH